MAFSLSGAINGGAQGYAASGSPWGAALGAIGGAFGSKKKRGPDEGDLAVMQGRQMNTYFANLMSAAESNGIHPLYALGANVSSGITNSVGGETSGQTDMSDIGQNIGAAVSRASSQGDREIGMASAKIALENGQLQNELLKSQIAQIRSSLNPPTSTGRTMLPGQAQTAESVIGSMPMNRVGYADKAKPMHSITYDERGEPIRIWNQDLGDNDIAQTAHLLRYSLPDYLHSYIGKPAGKTLAKMMRAYSKFGKGANNYRSTFNK